MGFWKSLYYCRVGIIGLLLIACLPFLTYGSTAAVFVGLFDIDGASPILGIALVTLTALIFTFSCVVVINLVLDHGPARFEGVKEVPPRYHPPRWLFCLSLFPGTWLIWRVCELSLELSAGQKFVGVAGGIFFALLGWLLAQTAQFALANQEGAREPQYLIYPLDTVPILGRLFTWAYQQEPCFNRQAQWLHEILRDKVFGRVGPGFLYRFRDAEQNEELVIYSGHLFALALCVLSLLLWLGIGYAKEPFLGDQRPEPVIPSLAFVLVAGVTLTWMLSALAFLLDYLRFPLFAGLGAIILTFGGVLHLGDHYFRVSRDTKPRPIGPKPSEVLAAHAAAGVPILIATAGGGIQAAYWTANTIEQLSRHPDLKGRFLPQLTAISSVSGGSVGSMFVGSALFDQTRSKVTSLKHAVTLSAESSLDEAAWGWMYADLRRALLPMFAPKLRDRGWALEIAWANRITGELPEMFLDDWAEYGKNHLATFPAFLFNSSNVERGSPLAFANNDFPAAENEAASKRGLKGFATQYSDPYARIRVVTAVRLSASFPFVSPAARAEIDPGFHFVDGGYYDNFGILALLDWLSQALNHEGMLNNGAAPKKIAVIVLRPFPDAVEPNAQTVGWSYQLYAPLIGSINILQKEQLKEDLAKFKLFQKSLTNIDLQLFEIAFPRDVCHDGSELPTSWKLTKAQQRCTTDAWEQINKEVPSRGTDSEHVAGVIKALGKFLEGAPEAALNKAKTGGITR